MSLAQGTILMVPLDVANTRLEGEIDMRAMWYTITSIMCFFLFIFVPIALFFYESEGLGMVSLIPHFRNPEFGTRSSGSSFSSSFLYLWSSSHLDFWPSQISPLISTSAMEPKWYLSHPLSSQHVSSLMLRKEETFPYKSPFPSTSQGW